MTQTLYAHMNKIKIKKKKLKIKKKKFLASPQTVTEQTHSRKASLS
jgi:hypothetical protein